MYKNTFLSGYLRGHGLKVFEIEIFSEQGSAQENHELEILKDKYAQFVLNQLILPKKKTIVSKTVYYFELWGDFTSKEVKNVKDFTMTEIPNFKQLEKDFKIQLRKDNEVEEIVQDAEV